MLVSTHDHYAGEGNYEPRLQINVGATSTWSKADAQEFITKLQEVVDNMTPI